MQKDLHNITLPLFKHEHSELKQTIVVSNPVFVVLNPVFMVLTI